MWRALTEADLVATLSAKEVAAFRESAGAASSGALDPVADLLARTAQMVRSYIRAGGRITLSPEGGRVPEGLISPACDYAAFDVLKRMPVAIGEDRRRAREQAIAIFEQVASGRVIPESEAGEGAVNASPRYIRKRKILD